MLINYNVINSFNVSILIHYFILRNPPNTHQTKNGKTLNCKSLTTRSLIEICGGGCVNDMWLKCIIIIIIIRILISNKCKKMPKRIKTKK